MPLSLRFWWIQLLGLHGTTTCWPCLGCKHLLAALSHSPSLGKPLPPMATWDAKVTTVLAMLGGTGPLLRTYMEERGVYGIFEDRVKSMYEPVFKASHHICDAWQGLRRPPYRAAATAALAGTSSRKQGVCAGRLSELPLLRARDQASFPAAEEAVR